MEEILTGKQIKDGEFKVWYILNHPSIIKPRCHWNKKNGKRQIQKRKFLSLKEARDYIDKRNLRNYEAYKCKICNCYHIGHIKNRIK